MIQYILLIVTISIILAVLGVVLIMLDALRARPYKEVEFREVEEKKFEESEEERRKKVKTGGVVLIGPVPIIFGTDRDIIKWAIILTVIVVTIFIIFTLMAMGMVRSL